MGVGAGPDPRGGSQQYGSSYYHAAQGKLEEQLVQTKRDYQTTKDELDNMLKELAA
jgi:hypothetical protein